MSFVRLLLLLVALAFPAAAFAQPGSTASAPESEATLAQNVDAARAQVDTAAATLKRDHLDDATLQTLRDQMSTLDLSLQDTISRLGPRVDAAKARLAQLGPKPDDKAPAEDPAITADRVTQQNLLAATEDLLKRARLLSVQAGQIGDSIVSRRRATFLKDLLEQSRGVFTPTLWRDVIKDFPHEVAALRQLGSDFLSRAGNSLAGWRLPTFLALLALIVALAVPVTKTGRRILRREPSITDPTPLHKVLGACWYAIVVAIVPIAIVMALMLLGNSFDLFSDRILPLVRTIVAEVTRVAVITALARATLAPDRPNWRLLSVPDAAAERLSHLLASLAFLVAVSHVLEVLHDIIVSSVSTTVLARGVMALLVSLVIAGGLYGLPQEAEDDDCLGPRVSRRRDWFGLIRLTGWIVGVVIFVAVVVGYVALGAFLAEQLVWVCTIGLAAFLLLQLAVDAVDAQFKPASTAGRLLSTSIGLRRERVGQIGILLSGALRVVVFVAAALLIVAPWGIQSDDLSGTLRAAYFGFAVGGVTISPSSLVTGVTLFAIVVVATRTFQAWLEDRFLPTTALDAGLRNSIRTIVGYLGFTVALAIALSQLGLSFDKLAIVAGALSVGIGFGLQSVVNNFVSGLILLWERAIRVGDWVVVGSDQGFVRRINVRSTEIETFDRAMMIVPNSTLVTGTVKNWVRSDRIGRIKIALTVQNGSDPDVVREALIAVAKENENISRLPVPNVLFADITAGGLAFELVCFVNDVETSTRVKSELHFAIFRRFAEAGIHISPPAPGPTLIALAPDTQDALRASFQRAAE